MSAPTVPACGAAAPNDSGMGPHAVECLKPAGHEYDEGDLNRALHEGPGGWRWASAAGHGGGELSRDLADALTEPLSAVSGVPQEYTRRVLRALLAARLAVTTDTSAATVTRTTEYAVDLPDAKVRRLVQLDDSDRIYAEKLAESPLDWDPPGQPGIVNARTVTTITGPWTPDPWKPATRKDTT